jgi:hypothetical protein
MAGGEAWRPLLAGAWLLWLLLPWASAVRRSDFPESFLFGTATSSYQVIALDLHHLLSQYSSSSSLPQPFGAHLRAWLGLRWKRSVRMVGHERVVCSVIS